MITTSRPIAARCLIQQDARQFRDVRLHGLLYDAVAFGGCHVEESQLSEIQFADFIPPAGASSAIFGAFFDTGELIGIAGLRVPIALQMRHKATLWGMYTMPTARGLGVGRMLMDCVLGHARSLPGVERVLLAVTASNTVASHWYASQGFQLYGIERNAVKFGTAYEDDELRVLDLYSESNAHVADEVGRFRISTGVSDSVSDHDV